MSRVREAGIEEKILDAAFSVFGEKGFQATTVKDIAGGADISSASIYTYFPDKEALFCSTVLRYWDLFIKELEKIASGALSQAERLAVLFDRGFAILGGAIPLVRGMLFDASKLNLIEPNLDRVCQAIDRLLMPDRGSPQLSTWEETKPRRLIVTRILILGILASAALAPTPDPKAAVDQLREATAALLTQTGLLQGQAYGGVEQ